MASASFVPPETTLEAFIEEQENKNTLSKTKRDVSLLKEFMRMKGKAEEFVSFSLIGFLSFRYFANMVYKAFRNSLVRYAHSFVSKVLRLVNKNPYSALSMK